MLRVLAVLAAAASCLVVSTCGTARAIVGDYEDDYVIRGIKPLNGVSGQQVKFEHQMCYNDGAIAFDYQWDVTNEEFTVVGVTGKPPAYTWDFGGGADPNVSYEIFPEVTLRDGIRAPYQCSVEVRGGCLDDEVVTATFTLDVAPLNVLTVTPTTGLAGGSATFSALIGSGTADSYAWDFGGAASPNGSNLVNPTVVISDTAAGVYQCRVVVSNSFEAYEFPFTLSVTQ